jgi:hypothetical protein
MRNGMKMALHKALLAISKQTRDELALPNARDLLFGEGLLTRAALSYA